LINKGEKTMKTIKQIGLIAMAIIAIGIIACNNGDNDNNTTADQSKERPAEKITFGADNALFTNISSTKALTDEQWATVKTKLTTVLDTASKSGGTTGEYCIVLFDGTVNIELGETKEYNYYKWDTVTFIIHFNADYVINASETDLLAMVRMAIDGDPLQD
jgi:hypothetical protein